MFKSLGNLLHKTPWWAIFLGGLFVFLLLALFTIPFNVISLSNTGTNTVEQRAIQREVDRSFGNSALNIAERVVKAASERTEDQTRKAELNQALKDIEAAREDMNSAASEVGRARAEAAAAASEISREAKRAVRDAERQIRNDAKDEARAERDAAREKATALREARAEAMLAQKRVGLDDASALTVFDNAIKEVEASQAAASQRIKDINSGKIKPEVTTPTVPVPPAPSSPSAPAKSGNKVSFKHDKTGEGKIITFTFGENKATADTVKIDGVIGTTSINGIADISAPEKSQLQINGAAVSLASPTPTTPPAAPAPPLTPEMRDDIRQKVAGDVKRLGIGSALTMMLIPLFIVLLIAKFYIGRSRRAIEIANIKTIEADSANVNRQIVEAKLMALQAQVEPHFLYNTLANVQALIEVDPPLANKMTGHLIEYLRAALPKMRENISSVGQEIELVTAYLNILKIRMGERLQFSVDVPADLLGLPFPPLMLPSLVENAVKHGLEPERNGGRIDVTVLKIGDGENTKIRLMVVDTGRGLVDSPIQSGGGVGLTNIRERLLALFGDAATLTLESHNPKGVAATIDVPAAGAKIFRIGSVATVANAAAASPAVPVPTKNWGSKTIHVAARTHSVWVNMLTKAFVGIIAVLIVVFTVLLIGLATNMFPLNVGSTKISGIEGMALGTIALIFTFGLLSVFILMIMGIIYGLGFVLVGLAVGVPLLILASIFPALAPLILVGGIVYWFWWRKKKKLSKAAALTDIKIS